VTETHTPETGLSVIIPAYNEADRIRTTLEKTLDYLETRPCTGEVIVVSDGSTDGTSFVAREKGRDRRVPLRVIEYHPNRGKGYAVRTGMRAGRGAVLMFMDADYSVPIEDMEKGMRLLRNGYDIAIGSRTLSESQVLAHQNVARELSAKVYTLVQNRYLGISYRDTQCGFKLFTRRSARILFARQKLHSVIFDPEILWLAEGLNFRTGEFPVHWRHIGDSRIQYDSFKKSIFVFQELFRIKRLHSKGSVGFSNI
jgi:glycosyltransferase involved in cell wall biosynthesis